MGCCGHFPTCEEKNFDCSKNDIQLRINYPVSLFLSESFSSCHFFQKKTEQKSVFQSKCDRMQYDFSRKRKSHLQALTRTHTHAEHSSKWVISTPKLGPQAQSSGYDINVCVSIWQSLMMFLMENYLKGRGRIAQFL